MTEKAKKTEQDHKTKNAMWKHSTAVGTVNDKQCWYMHKEIFSGKKNIQPFFEAYRLKEDDTCLVIKNCLDDEKFGHYTNT